LILLVFLRLFFCWHPAILPAYLLLSNVPTTQEIALSEDPAILKRVDRTRNAAWLEHRWFQAGVTPTDLEALAKRLAQNKIHYLYPHLTPTDPAGHLPQHSDDAVRKFTTKMRHDIPGIQILPWVGGVQKGYKQTSPGTLDFNSPAMRDAFAADCSAFIEKYHLDGIHLNIEPVESGDARFVEWVGAIKKRIGDHKVLSVAAAKPSLFEGFNVAPLRAWDLDYFVSVGRHCDQLVIMNYDTSFNTQLQYSLFTEDKLSRLLARFAQEKLACKILIGIPTYDPAARHDVKAENIPGALQGMRAALSHSPQQNFEGAAIYADWTTSDAEWQQFRDGWLNISDHPQTRKK